MRIHTRARSEKDLSRTRPTIRHRSACPAENPYRQVAIRIAQGGSAADYRRSGVPTGLHLRSTVGHGYADSGATTTTHSPRKTVSSSRSCPGATGII